MLAASLPYAFALLSPLPAYVIAASWIDALPSLGAIRAQLERL